MPGSVAGSALSSREIGRAASPATNVLRRMSKPSLAERTNRVQYFMASIRQARRQVYRPEESFKAMPSRSRPLHAWHDPPIASSIRNRLSTDEGRIVPHAPVRGGDIALGHCLEFADGGCRGPEEPVFRRIHRERHDRVVCLSRSLGMAPQRVERRSREFCGASLHQRALIRSRCCSESAARQ